MSVDYRDELIAHEGEEDPGAWAQPDESCVVLELPSANPLTPSTRGPKLIDPAFITIRDVRWLVRHFVLRDSLNLVQGHGGSNKGTFCCHLGAQATRGELSPDGTPMMVLYACAEDDKETVLQPRLIAAGADLRYVRFLEDWTFPRDIDNGSLRARIREVNAGILFIDPLVTFMDPLDSHKDQDVKQSLTVLLQMAQEEQFTAIGVHHFTKDTRLGALLAGNGSGAFGNTARLVLAMVKDDEDENLRILEVVKTNGGPCHINQLYRVDLKYVDGLTEPLPIVEHIGESSKSADEALSSQGKGGKSKTDKARELILDILENEGEQESKALDARVAAEVGLGAGTIKNARIALGKDDLLKNRPEKNEHGEVLRWFVSRSAVAR
jgi:hypothetical protein